jgi:hypothetical protein
VYAEVGRRQLIITKVGKKSLIFEEHERAWKDALPTLEPNPERPDGHGALPAFDPKAADKLLEQHAADGNEAVNLAARLALAIARMPQHKRIKLIGRLNGLIGELDPSTHLSAGE